VTSVDNWDSVAELAMGVKESCPATALDDRPIEQNNCVLIPWLGKELEAFELLAVHVE
jgi:hypothetical protein